MVSDRFEMAEPYLDYASALGYTACWQRGYNPLVTRNLARVIWDDSVGAATCGGLAGPGSKPIKIPLRRSNTSGS